MATNDTLSRVLSGIAALKDRIATRYATAPVWDRFTSLPLNTAGLTIKAGGSAIVKSGATDFYALAGGTLVTIAASTDMPALVGSITATKYNVYCFFVDSAGTKTSVMGTEGAAIGSLKFPSFPEKKALIGFILVTYASTFVGGTTALDTATTVYFSPTAPFDPAALLGY